MVKIAEYFTIFDLESQLIKQLARAAFLCENLENLTEQSKENLQIYLARTAISRRVTVAQEEIVLNLCK